MDNQSVQNSVSEPVLTPVQNPEPKPKFPVMYLVLSVFILLFIASTAFLYYQNMQLKKMLANYQTPVSSPTPSATADPTANWKTFSDSTSGVEFKYPNDWIAKQMKGWALTVFLDNKDFVIPEASEFMTPIQVALNEVMNTNTNVKSYSETTVDDAVKRFKTYVFGENVKETDGLTIDGHKTIQLTGTAGPGMLEGQYFKITYIQMDGKVLIVTLNNTKNYEAIYGQILSTFKFTQ